LIFALTFTAMVESNRKGGFLGSNSNGQDCQRQYLHENWTFKQVGNETFYAASSVPGTVHQDLLALNIIPDPYYRDNLWTI